MSVGFISSSTPRPSIQSGSCSHRGQVDSGERRQHAHDKLELSGEGRALSNGLMGKLNALEHSASQQAEPGVLKGILQKLTGQKVDDVDVDMLQFSQSDASIDVTRLTAQTQPDSSSFTYEHLSAQSSQMSLSIQGSLETKSGAEADFSLKMDVSRLVAAYQKYSMSTTQGASGSLDVGA